MTTMLYINQVYNNDVYKSVCVNKQIFWMNTKVWFFSKLTPRCAKKSPIMRLLQTQIQIAKPFSLKFQSFKWTEFCSLSTSRGQLMSFCLICQVLYEGRGGMGWGTKSRRLLVGNEAIWCTTGSLLLMNHWTHFSFLQELTFSKHVLSKKASPSLTGRRDQNINIQSRILF